MARTGRAGGAVVSVGARGRGGTGRRAAPVDTVPGDPPEHDGVTGHGQGGQEGLDAELANEKKVRVTAILRMEGSPRTVDSDEDSDEWEVSMIVSDPETKLVDIIGELESNDTVGMKLKGAGMKKLRVGVPMRGGIVKLAVKSAAKDKGMASQHLRGFETGAVVLTAEAKGGAGPSTAQR